MYPPKPPAFSTWIYFRGERTEITEHWIVETAQRGLTQREAERLALVASKFGFSPGDMVAAALNALDLDPPTLQGAAASAGAFIRAHQARLNEGNHNADS
jgi:hypothetical protein